MGERGLMGLPGKDAKASELYRPLEWFGCLRSLDLINIASGSVAIGSDGLLETTLNYTLMRYSNGDVEVSCTSALGAAASGSGHQYFPAAVMGSVTAVCATPGVDYPATQEDLVAGGWVYSLKPQPTAAYSDAAGHWLNGMTFTFGENDCNALVADDQGEWLDAALSDVL